MKEKKKLRLIFSQLVVLAKTVPRKGRSQERNLGLTHGWLSTHQDLKFKN